MASKLINLVALSTLAVLAVSFGPTSTNALATGHAHMNRHFDHAPIAAKKKRDTKRCKPRDTTTSTPAPATTSTTSSKTTPKPTEEPKTTTTKAATTTKTTSQPASTPSSGGGAAGSGKFGQKGSKICAAWGNGNDVASLKEFKTDHVVGLYTWGPDRPDAAPGLGYDFWPMLWGGSDDKISDFEKQLGGDQLGSVLLGFNEPNENGQSAMNPQDAANLWKQHIEPKRSKGYKLASPAMSSRPNGQQWMTDFMKACTGCHVDYQAVHWYDTSFEKFKTYLTDYHNQLGLPILVTEFADQNFNGGAQASQSEIFAFMGQALQFIDDTDWILAACPFGIMKDLPDINQLNRLQSTSGSITDLGYMVINNSY